MNMVDLLKKLFAILTAVSMVLAYAVRPFLQLLSVLPEATGDDEDNWHSCYSGRVHNGQGPLPGGVHTFYED